MKYAEKIRHAEKAAAELTNQTSIDEVRVSLKEKGLYERDIDNVITSARNIIGDNLKPIIRTKLLAGTQVAGAPEFEKLDPATLKKLVKREIEAISMGEREKVKTLLNNKTPHQDIYKEIRLDFYSKEDIDYQISVFEEVKKQNSGGNRMLNILGGLGMSIVGIGFSVASMQNGGSGRLFIGLIIFGFFLMIKGFMTVENPY